MRQMFAILIGLSLSGCTTSDVFNPKSQYQPDPWVKGYADENDWGVSHTNPHTNSLPFAPGAHPRHCTAKCGRKFVFF